VAAKVFLLDDDEDLRDSLGALISCITRECVTAGTLDEAKARASQIFDCQLALLDINLGAGQPSGVDAYRWLRAQGFRGRISFVTGHAASHPLVREAQALGDVSIYEKPLEMPQLVALIRSGTE
jgi:DNA-binding NtrC family response regulator